MKYLIFVLTLSFLHAEFPGDDPARPSINKTGEVFVLKFTPKSNLLEIRFADNPVAAIEPADLQVRAKRYPSGGSLKLQIKGSNFKVDKIEKADTLELHIEHKETQKSETLTIQLGKP